MPSINAISEAPLSSQAAKNHILFDASSANYDLVCPDSALLIGKVLDSQATNYDTVGSTTTLRKNRVVMNASSGSYSATLLDALLKAKNVYLFTAEKANYSVSGSSSTTIAVQRKINSASTSYGTVGTTQTKIHHRVLNAQYNSFSYTWNIVAPVYNYYRTFNDTYWEDYVATPIGHFSDYKIEDFEKQPFIRSRIQRETYIKSYKYQ